MSPRQPKRPATGDGPGVQPAETVAPPPASSARDDGDPLGVDRRPDLAFPVVGIGASAGGLDPIRELLARIPPDSGMAFLVVQHLAPFHESQLAPVLARATKMPVADASNGARIEPDHVYVIPPNSTMRVADGALQITPRQESEGPHLPIDELFRSIAERQQSRAIGVVLSGMGADGTLGLMQIKAVGGITFAQDDSAQHAPMPRSAIQSGSVDFVLAPARIGERLARIAAHPYLSARAQEDEADDTRSEQFRGVLAIVKAHSGVDFTQYRDTTIHRRIMRRMALHAQPSITAYTQQLAGDRHEMDALYNDLLINVTSFFRDPAMFEALKSRVLPEIMRNRSLSTPLRAWVPGCSSGQEPYSLAIALLEYFADERTRPPIQIFATDLSDGAALDKARAGVYPATIEAEVSAERLRRFFKREDNVYRVNKQLRDLCVFARQNVAADPPFSNLDLITCRNVLIYFSPALQRRVMPAFHFALRTPGYLVLGPSETVGDGSELFEMVDRPNRIYVKKPDALRSPMHFSTNERAVAAAEPRRFGPASRSGGDFQREIDRMLLGRFAPPGVLVDENFEVLQYRGKTGPYLEIPHGEPTNNLLKIVHESLYVKLRAALHEASARGVTVRSERMPLRLNGSVRRIDLEVIPLRGAAIGDGGGFLVLFLDVEDEPAAMPGAAAPAPPRDASHATEEAELREAHRELAATKDYLQSLAQQQDAATEELRSANEEILSSNEELQSTNEELQTAKEELQSANEELTTVNEQLSQRNAELSHVNSDLTNLLSSTNIPVVMVDGDLRVRRYTPPARRVLSVAPTDVGRALHEVPTLGRIPGMAAIAAEVMETMQVREIEIADDHGHWFALRVSPYRTVENKIDGVVMVLVDIDAHKRTSEMLRLSERRKDEFLATLAHELRNPLAPIRNALEILARTKDPAAVAEAHTVLERQSRQLSRIVEDLVDIGRIVARKIELRRERIPISTVIAMAVETCRAQHETCRDRMTISLPDEPIYVEGDSARLAQVLINLLNNAAKFSGDAGRIWVTVEVETAPASDAEHEAKSQVVIRVRDNGIGIDAEFLPRMFDMFTQGDGGGAPRARGGLGVGLTLVKGLVEMHGGNVSVSSRGPGEGSEFTVRLPLSRQPRAGAGTLGARTRVVTKPTAPRRVLVVDDNRDQTETLASLLRLMGHEVRTAYDGPSGFEAALKFLPDVALIDIGLPGMNGHELGKRFRADPKLRNVVLVAQSGWGHEDDRMRSLEAGFDRHVVKPVDPGKLDELCGAVRDGS